jgi:DNA-binding SARP family transcriptional activator/TolB-like protein
MLGVLWPESDPERARHALSQTLYSLRRDLGAEVVVSTPELRLDAQQIATDLDAFRRAVAERRWAEAATLYSGPFLDGFYLADAPEFERWVDAERAVLAADGMRAIEIVATEDTATGRLEKALDGWRRLSVFDPLSGRIAASYMETLVARGDRATALAHGKAHIELLERELEAQPDAAIEELMLRLRGDNGASSPKPTANSPSVAHAAPAARTASPAAPAAPAPMRLQRRSIRAAAIVGAIAASVLIVAVAWRAYSDRRAAAPRVLAVGKIRDLVSPDSAMLGTMLGEMLATSLGRLHELQVVANSRMLELTPRDADTARTALTEAARRAGATEILEGELLPLPGNTLRLEVRRVEIARGIVRGGYQVDGKDRLALFDSVTMLIAADLRTSATRGTLADLSTRSPVAYRLYDDGLRAFYQFDSYAANRLFHAAIREDSMFAMATYYAWRAAVSVNATDQDSLAARAVALAPRAPDRDRLLILAHVGLARLDQRAVAAADTLAMRYPSDPEALNCAADATSDVSRSVVLLNRSIALDSAAGISPSSVCRLCEALNLLAARYAGADSSAAVERTLKRWIAQRPVDNTPWLQLADHLVGMGRFAEARAAQQRAEALGAKSSPLRDVIWDLRGDDVDDLEPRCRAGLASADADLYLSYRRYCVIGLRMQGRYRDALRLARDGRIPQSGTLRRGFPADTVHFAILDMEMGRPVLAATAFAATGALGADSMRYSEGQRAQANAWRLTLAATALVAAHDTIRARTLVDSIEAIGRRALYGRDPLLHHFVRGLLLASSRQQESAVRQFQAAMFSPTNGYTRINYETARSLLALNRPGEAIPVLRAVLHGGVEGSGLYLTRTETHELLAQAFDAAGQRDSAAVHYSKVEHSWRGADSILQPRYDAARQWLLHAGKLAR